ncbi:MarR family transcriptional regulator [Helicobacter sp. MIT 21-1697]|uniref:MarR family winged helix-turn-helix transcriptional regulator n=1 Tax=Helicobacter sp. MIT 21-1697 TaxID=2993733 RepID=UPI00224B502A|nr:MarR family transcriptional regulator [Helicobacter sp. MIT 21-1697]MCX2717058.1 MarR family transcriptional regulator [Helicobacter sp. MIT 21-1697]
MKNKRQNENKQSCDIYKNIGFLATHLRENLSAEFDRRVAPLGIIHHKQAGILWVCSQNPHSQISLCNFASSDKNYVRMYIDDLESKGLVERKQNPANRRENLITLTPSGKEYAQKTYQIMKEVHNDLLLEYISEEEMQELHRILYKAIIGLEHKKQKLKG